MRTPSHQLTRRRHGTRAFSVTIARHVEFLVRRAPEVEGSARLAARGDALARSLRSASGTHESERRSRVPTLVAAERHAMAAIARLASLVPGAGPSFNLKGRRPRP